MKLNEAFEELYGGNCERENNSYVNLDVQAMYLVFSAGWTAHIEELICKRERAQQNEYVNQNRRWNDD